MAIRAQDIALCDFCKDPFPLVMARYEDGDFYQFVSRVAVVKREAGRAALPTNGARTSTLVFAEPLNKISRVLLDRADAFSPVSCVPVTPVLLHLLPVVGLPFFCGHCLPQKRKNPQVNSDLRADERELQDSNPRPLSLEPNALPTVLNSQYTVVNGFSCLGRVDYTRP